MAASAPVRIMTQGKIERQIEAFINYCNHCRYHDSLDTLTPADGFVRLVDVGCAVAKIVATSFNNQGWSNLFPDTKGGIPIRAIFGGGGERAAKLKVRMDAAMGG